MWIERYKKAILKKIFHHVDPKNCLVFLFGSYVQGNTTKTSDIDIGILTKNPLSPKAFLEMDKELNEDLPLLRDIDLVDFRSISKEVKKEALKEINLWHTGKNCHDLLKNLGQV